MRALILICFLVLMLTPTVVTAQTISPVVSECSAKKCAGAFTVTNNGLQPMTVTVEPFSTTISVDGALLHELDSNVSVDLSEGSARLSPKGSHSFDYRVRCGEAPCIVTFLSSMVVGKTADGILVRVQLPFVAYACAKQKNCRADVRRSAGLVQ